MISRILFVGLLFLLPFALYAVYLRVREVDEEVASKQHPWTALFISGLVLVAASFLFWGLFENAKQRGVYVPPHLEDGRLVPGRVISEEETKRSTGGTVETNRVETGGPQ